MEFMFRLAKYIIIFCALFVGLSLFYAPAPVQAQTCGSTKGTCDSGELDDNGVYESDSYWTWDCVEQSSGISRSCTLTKDAAESGSGSGDGDSGSEDDSGGGGSGSDGGLENLPGMDLKLSNIYCIFLRFMTWFFSFALVLAIISLVYNGLRYITSSGNSDELAKINKNFWWTLIGVVVVLLATSILLMIANFLGVFTASFKIFLLPFEEIGCEITWWASLINSVGEGLGIW